MNVPLKSPTYTCIIKRLKIVEFKYYLPNQGAVAHVVIAAAVSIVPVGDNAVLPTLLNPLRRKIQQVSTYGTYDIKACHHVLKNKGITLSIYLETM